MDKTDALIESRAREALNVLSRYAQIAGAYIFGSQVDGSTDDYSDIDLGVFIDGIEEWDILKRVKTSAQVQKEAGDDIEIHFFPAPALANPESASFSEFVIKHGKRIDR